MIAGTIEIQMMADLARLQQDMDKATSLVGRATDKLESMAVGAVKALSMLGVGLSVGAIANWASGVLDAAGAIHDLSTQTGASVESLSRFQEIGRTSGTTADTIAAAMGRLAKNTALSDDESKLAALSLKAMGIEFDGFKKLKPDEQLLAVAKAMDKYQNGAGKSAIAQALLGKEGAKLLPFLKDLANDTETAAVLTAKQAAAADELGDKMTAMKARVQGAAASFALDLLPALDKITALFVPAATVAAAYFAIFVGFPAIATAAVAGFNAVMLALSGMGATAVTASASLMTLHTAGLALIALFAGWQIGTWLRENFLEAQLAGVAFVEGTMLAWERLKLVALSAWAVIESGWESTLSGMTGFMGAFLQKIAGGLSALGLDDAAAKVLSWATKVTDAGKSSGDLAAKLGTLKAQYDTAAASVRTITGDMANDAIAKANSTAATDKNKQSTGALAAAIDAAKAKLEAEKKAREQATAAADAAAKKHQELLDSYVKLSDGVLSKARATEQEEAIGRKLTDSEQAWLKVAADVAAGRITTTELVKNGTVAKLQEAAALEASAAARQRDLQWMKETGAENAKFRDSVYASTDSIRDQVDKQRQANDQLGLSKEALAQLSIQKDLDRAATLERNATIMEEIDADLAAEWRKQAGALRELADLKGQGIHVQSARDADEAWRKTTESIERGLTDSLFRAFESGKNFFSVLWEGVKNTFKVTILKPIIEDTTKEFIGWFKQAVFGIESSAIRPVVQNVWSTFLSWFGGAANVIETNPINPQISTGGLDGWLNAFSSGLNTVLSWFGTSWQSLFSGFTSGLGSLVSGVGSLLGSDTLGSAGTWLSGVNAASGATGGAGGGLGSLGTIGGALTKLFGGGSAAGGAGTVVGGSGLTLGGVTGSVGSGAGVITGGTGLSGAGSTIGSGIGSTIGTGSGTAVGGVGAGSGGAGLGTIGSLGVVGAAFALGSYLQGRDNGQRITGFAASDPNYNSETTSPGLDGIGEFGGNWLPAKNVYLMDQRGPQDAAAQEILNAVATQYQTIARALGGTPGQLTGAVAIELNPTSPDRDNVFALDAKLNGVDIYSRNNRKSGGGTVDDFGDSTDELKRVVDKASSWAVLKALQATDFGAYLNTQLSYIDGNLGAATTQAEITRLLRSQGVPGYASGGMHSGGLRIVGEGGAELEATGPARYYSAADTRAMLSGGGQAEVVAELRALRQENAELRRAVDRVVTHTGESRDVLRRVSRDGVTLATVAA